MPESFSDLAARVGWHRQEDTPRRLGGGIHPGLIAGHKRWRESLPKRSEAEKKALANARQTLRRRAIRERDGYAADAYGEKFGALSIELKISFMPDEIDQIDAVCERLGTGRSHLIRRAIAYAVNPESLGWAWKPDVRCALRRPRRERYCVSVRIDATDHLFLNQRSHPDLTCDHRRCVHLPRLLRVLVRRFLRELSTAGGTDDRRRND